MWQTCPKIYVSPLSLLRFVSGFRVPCDCRVSMHVHVTVVVLGGSVRISDGVLVLKSRFLKELILYESLLGSVLGDGSQKT